MCKLTMVKQKSLLISIISILYPLNVKCSNIRYYKNHTWYLFEYHLSLKLSNHYSIVIRHADDITC